MNLSDIIFVLRWWLMFFVIGLIFLPLTTRIFSNFFDKGYIFAKVIGVALISYAVFLLGILKIAPFTELTIILTITGFLIINILLISKYSQKNTSEEPIQSPRRWPHGLLRGGRWKIFIFEEIPFLAALFFWSFIRAHEPSIHGLEKYMDFGFVNSIIRSEHFPPVDMWFSPLPINYYYFGHLVTAVLTKLSNIPSSVTYNLMLSTLFAFTFTAAFSIGGNLIYLKVKSQKSKVKIIGNSKVFRNLDFDNWSLFGNWKLRFGILATGLLSAFLVSLAGNLHAIYAFFKPYANENPAPFWQLAFSPNSFPNSYWYPNATRFIENTIHEFPVYSSVVSDLHGHYLDVPFVLLTIAVLLSLIFKSQIPNPKSQINPNVQNNKPLAVLNFGNWNLFGIWKLGFRNLLLMSFLLAVLYMTNAWDGIIYFLLTVFVLFYIQWRRIQTDTTVNTTNNPILQILPINKRIKKIFNNWIIDLFIGLFVYLFILLVGFMLFSFPFNVFFKPFASGVGILCAPEFLTNIGKLGPLIFEKDHCQHSPWWQLLILYGFFYFWVLSFLIFLITKKNHKSKITNHKQIQNYNIQNSKYFGFLNFKNWRLFGIWNLESGILTSSDLFVLILIFISTILIIIPEFIYIKDIYPGHYRANTMFKLVYQSFIVLSIASAYIAVRLISNIKDQISKMKIKNKIFNFYYVYLLFAILFFILVMIYPYFAINSYYGDLKTYYGLDGTLYLKKLYPTDYSAIVWINKNIKGQPVILEAQGDSYTDYARVSSNTGLPTVLGWTVHEWLWRGSYDIPSPRIAEVQKMYDSDDLAEAKQLFKKHDISLVFIGELEKQKYSNLNEEKFKTLGKIIYQNGNTKIYKIK